MLPRGQGHPVTPSENTKRPVIVGRGSERGSRLRNSPDPLHSDVSSGTISCGILDRWFSPWKVSYSHLQNVGNSHLTGPW